MWQRRSSGLYTLGRAGPGINITVPTGGGGSPPPLAITTTNVSNVINGSSYSETLAATGGSQPYTWSVFSGSLPTGLSLNSATGEISGTAGGSDGVTYNFTIRCTDDDSNTDDQALSITVQAASTSYPNEPASMTKMARFDGTEVQTTDTVSSWGYYWGWDTRVTSIVDATNPIGTGYVLNFPWTTTTTPGLASMNQFDADYDEIYVTLRIKYDPSWEHVGHKNFYFGTAMANRSGQGPSHYFTTREASDVMNFTQQWATPTSQAFSAGGAWSGADGNWVHMEMHAIGESSVGAGDGKVYVWLDGVLVGSNEAFAWTDGSDTVSKFSGFHWYATRNQLASYDTWYRVGELYISAK